MIVADWAKMPLLVAESADNSFDSVCRRPGCGGDNNSS